MVLDARRSFAAGCICVVTLCRVLRDGIPARRSNRPHDVEDPRHLSSQITDMGSARQRPVSDGRNQPRSTEDQDPSCHTPSGPLARACLIEIQQVIDAEQEWPKPLENRVSEDATDEFRSQRCCPTVSTQMMTRERWNLPSCSHTTSKYVCTAYILTLLAFQMRETILGSYVECRSRDSIQRVMTAVSAPTPLSQPLAHGPRGVWNHSACRLQLLLRFALASSSHMRRRRLRRLQRQTSEVLVQCSLSFPCASKADFCAAKIL